MEENDARAQTSPRRHVLRVLGLPCIPATDVQSRLMKTLEAVGVYPVHVWIARDVDNLCASFAFLEFETDNDKVSAQKAFQGCGVRCDHG